MLINIAQYTTMTKILSAEEEFLKAVNNILEVQVVEEYRAYYDEDGWITGFTASGFPEGDNWIHIDRELYITHNWRDLKLVDGKIVHVPPTYYHYFPLTKSDKGVKVVKYHASVVVEPHEEYNEVEYYDRNS